MVESKLAYHLLRTIRFYNRNIKVFCRFLNVYIMIDIYVVISDIVYIRIKMTK